MSSCKACPQHEFQDQGSQSSCKSCAEGQYQLSQSSTHCLQIQDCQGQWGNWGACDCQSGNRERHFTVNTAASWGGAGCEANDADVDTKSCSEICRDGQILDDPHFTGFDGSVYDFQGEPGSWFNLITDRYFQLNAFFVEAPTDHQTYMGQLAFIIHDKEILVFPDHVIVDGTVIEHGRVELLDSDSGTRTGFLRIRSTGASIFSGAWNLEIQQESVSGFRYLNVEASLGSTSLFNPHGILGQTAKFLVLGEEPNPVKVPHKNKNARGFLEGDAADYLVPDGSFGTGFKFNRYGVFEEPHKMPARQAFGGAIYKPMDL